MKKLLLLLFFAPLLLAATCEDEDDLIAPPCTTEVIDGLVVKVKDANTDAILSDGVLVTATDGSFTEDLDYLSGIESFSGVAENPGTYVITVSKTGYATYESEPITVAANQCHVIPENLTVVLTAQ